MNKSECLVADWQVIGLEDGSAGRQTSYLGQHRSACAEYGVKPDLQAYLAGHRQGILQYCRFSTGYRLAESGRGYNDVCPASEFPDFLSGFREGRQAYELKSELNRLTQIHRNLDNRLAAIDNEIADAETLIVADETPEEERVRLLRSIKLLNDEASDIKIELTELDEDIARARYQYERFLESRK